MTAPSSAPPLRVGAGAHRGKVREENQDRISRFRSAFGEVFVVADGVGGSQGGAQAAEMVVNGLEAHLAGLPADTPPAEALQEAARRTSADVHQRAQSGDSATANMAATGVLALLSGLQARVAHAGDSRAYLLRGGELTRLTRDHTRIQQMLERNLLSEEEAREHPDASIVTRAFGKEPDLELEVSAPFELRDGDLLLLSSDGLCGYVEDAAIRAALLAGGDAQEIADRLIALALDAGGEDNVSLQVIVPDAAATLAPAAPLALPATRNGRRPISWMSIAALLVLAFLAGLLLPWDRWAAAGRKWWSGGEPARRDGGRPASSGTEAEPPRTRTRETPRGRRQDRRERTPPEVPEGAVEPAPDSPPDGGELMGPPEPPRRAVPAGPSIRIELHRGPAAREQPPRTEDIEIPSVDSTEPLDSGSGREMS
jgi:serine/threonine protein phosphatase PrpC